MIPECFAYQSPQEALMEAMDYEFNARFDRWEGYGDPEALREIDYPEGPVRISLPVIDLNCTAPDDNGIPF